MEASEHRLYFTFAVGLLTRGVLGGLLKTVPEACPCTANEKHPASQTRKPSFCLLF